MEYEEVQFEGFMEEVIFDELYDPKGKRALNSDVYLLDPTLNVAHALVMAKRIARKLDEAGFM